MDREKLKAAIAEAERFLNRATGLLEIHEQPYVRQARVPDHSIITEYPREQGAVKRASMDLTRALADLRGRRKW